MELPEIPEEIARAEGVPEDLDSSVLGPYTVPNLRRRARAAVVYLVGAALALASIAAGLPAGMWFIAALLVVVAIFHLAGAWDLKVREQQALQIANRETDFPVGHASAALGFDGLRARPVWNVLTFSADDPPSQRGLIRVDGVDGSVKGVYVEDNPEA